MPFAVLLLLEVAAAADCAPRHNPPWLPSGHGTNGYASRLQSPQSHLGLLCCDGKWGGVPDKNSAIRAWQELDGAAVPLVSMDAGLKVKCTSQVAPRVKERQRIFSGRPQCAATDHFPALFDQTQCSMGVNTETETFEFAKCCDGTFGLVGTFVRANPKTNVPFRFFKSEEECKLARCPSSIQRCEFPEAVYEEESNTCKNFTERDRWSIKRGFSCSWPDDLFRIASYSSPARCIEDCSEDDACEGVELTLSTPPLCTSRTNTCKTPKRTRAPKVTMAKRGKIVSRSDGVAAGGPELSYEFYAIVLCLGFLFIVAVLLSFRKPKSKSI